MKKQFSRPPIILIIVAILDVVILGVEIWHGLYKKAISDALLFSGWWMIIYGAALYLNWKFQPQPPRDDDPGQASPGLQ